MLNRTEEEYIKQSLGSFDPNCHEYVHAKDVIGYVQKMYLAYIDYRARHFHFFLIYFAAFIFSISRIGDYLILFFISIISIFVSLNFVIHDRGVSHILTGDAIKELNHFEKILHVDIIRRDVMRKRKDPFRSTWLYLSAYYSCAAFSFVVAAWSGIKLLFFDTTN